VEDIVAVLDDLGIATAHYFGYSMGGWIGFGAARYASKRFRSLIIGGADPYASSADGWRQFIRIAVEQGPETFVAMWEEEYGALPPALRERMPSYDYEILLVVAQDHETCAKQIPNATFFTLPGLDHGGAIIRSDEVVPHVKRFLAEVEQRADGA
jgi:hypothetical protein